MTVLEILKALKRGGVPEDKLCYVNGNGFAERVEIRRIVNIGTSHITIEKDSYRLPLTVNGPFINTKVRVTSVRLIKEKGGLRPSSRVLLTWSKVGR